MATRVIETGYSPRPAQQILHRELRRYNVLLCHRRFGKTVFCLNEMLDRGLRCPLRNPQYAYVAPFYGQAKRVAWDYLKDFTRNLPGRHVHEGELRIDIPRRLGDGSTDRLRFMLMGADNPDALPGLYLDGLVLDEFGLMLPSIWSRIFLPMLSDREGWAIFVGTLEGRNHFYDLIERARENAKQSPEGAWYVSPEWMGDAYATDILSSDELALAKAEMPEEEFNEQFRSIPSGVKGAYYAEQMRFAEESDPPRITNVPFDPTLKTEVFFDLGIRDAMALWVVQQLNDKEIHAIDYMEGDGEGLEYYASYLQRQEYFKSISRIVFPHDGAARSLQAQARTRQEVMEELLGMHVDVLERVNIQDGINAVRMLLPRVWFDQTRCKRGIECLKNYTKVWDERRSIFLAKPRHDEWSHGADAFRYVAMGLGSPRKRFDIKKIGAMIDYKYDPFAL